MTKKYIKKIHGIPELQIITNKPIWSELKDSDLYTNRNWCVDGIWYQNIGRSLSTEILPFPNTENTLFCKYPLNNNVIDLISNTPANVVGDLSFTKHNSSYVLNGSDYSNVVSYCTTNLVFIPKVELGYSISVFTGYSEYGADYTGNICTLCGELNSEIINQRLQLTNKTLEFLYIDSINNVNVLTYNHNGSISELSHICVTVSKYEVRLYINGALVSIWEVTVPIVFKRSRLIFGNNISPKTVKIKQLEIYHGELAISQVRELYNQESYLPVKCDGLFNTVTGKNNPPHLAYLEDGDKLMYLLTDIQGNIVSKGLEDKITNTMYSTGNDNLEIFRTNNLNIIQNLPTLVSSVQVDKIDTDLLIVTTITHPELQSLISCDFKVMANHLLIKNISTAIKSNSVVLSVTLEKEKLYRLKNSDAELIITIIADSPINIPDCDVTTLKYKGKTHE